MALRLRVVSADGRRFDHEVAEGSLVVGRSSRADLSLADRAMSREHARFRREEEGWYVEDLGSTNGTWLADARVADPVPVPLGAPVRVGQTVLELRRGR